MERGNCQTGAPQARLEEQDETDRPHVQLNQPQVSKGQARSTGSAEGSLGYLSNVQLSATHKLRSTEVPEYRGQEGPTRNLTHASYLLALPERPRFPRWKAARSQVLVTEGKSPKWVAGNAHSCNFSSHPAQTAQAVVRSGCERSYSISKGESPMR
jgi:hypothetical protein